MELVHKNGWAAVKLLENIERLENIKNDSFKNNDSIQRFLRMLKIELSVVANEFFKIVISRHDKKWLNIYTDDIEKFTQERDKFLKENKSELLKTNEFEITRKVLHLDTEFNLNSLFNCLWIKQKIYNDIHKNIDDKLNIKDDTYQKKINDIIDMMIKFFPDKVIKKDGTAVETNVKAFFIVTDEDGNANVLDDKDNLLFEIDVDIRRFRFLIESIKNDRKAMKDNLCNDRDSIRRKLLAKFSEAQIIDLFNNPLNPSVIVYDAAKQSHS